MQRPAKPLTPVRFRIQPPRSIMNKKISIFGLGYVGTSLVALLSKKNYVTAIDVDINKITLLNNKQSPINDADIQATLINEEHNIIATSDINSCIDSDFIVVAVPTNYDEESDFFDTKIVENLIKDILDINNKALIVIKSTVPVGFTDQVNALHKTNRIIFSPEFLREGSALRDNLCPSRIILGSKSSQSEAFAKLLCDAATKSDIPIIYTGSKEAESIKLFSNTYLAMRVAFFNELDTFAHNNNLDVSSIINGVSFDSRIGSFYNNPSFGYGGYCLPKDTKQLLANFKNIPQNIIGAIVASNETRKDYLTRAILDLKPRCVGVYKLAMKSNSDNFRSSSIISITRKLKEFGINIIIFEPNLNDKFFLDNEIIANLDEFKSKSDLILTNRSSKDLEDISSKVFTRDVFHDN